MPCHEHDESTPAGAPTTEQGNWVCVALKKVIRQCYSQIFSVATAIGKIFRYVGKTIKQNLPIQRVNWLETFRCGRTTRGRNLQRSGWFLSKHAWCDLNLAASGRIGGKWKWTSWVTIMSNLIGFHLFSCVRSIRPDHRGSIHARTLTQLLKCGTRERKEGSRDYNMETNDGRFFNAI